MTGFLKAEVIGEAITESPSETLDNILMEMGGERLQTDKLNSGIYRRAAELILQLLAQDKGEIYLFGNSNPIKIDNGGLSLLLSYNSVTGEYVILVMPEKNSPDNVKVTYGTKENKIDKLSGVKFNEMEFRRFSQRLIGFWILDLLDYLEKGGGTRFGDKYVSWDIPILRSLVIAIIQSDFKTSLSQILSSYKAEITKKELKGKIGELFEYGIPLIITKENNGREDKKYLKVALGHIREVNGDKRIIPNLSELLLYTLGIIYPSRVSDTLKERDLKDNSWKRKNDNKYLTQVVEAFGTLLKEKILFDIPIIYHTFHFVYPGFINDDMPLLKKGIFGYARVVENIVR